MIYHTRRPRPPLDGAVAALWYFASPPRPFALERVLPTGAAQIVVNLAEDRTRLYSADRPGVCHMLPGAVVSGISTRFEIIDTAEQEHVVGASLRPGGTVGFFPEPAHHLGPGDVPLEALWGVEQSQHLREALLAAATPEATLDVLEQALRARWRERRPHRAVAFAVDAFSRHPHLARVGQVADAAGLSAKRFTERFKAEIGLTPKQFCRVVRFQRAVTRAHAGGAVDWAALAVTCGYFDQAHFIHDFRAFSGVTPAGYRNGRTEFQNHVAFLQSPPA